MLASEAVDILTRSVGNVIETMCFAAVTCVPSESLPNRERPITSSVSFDGPFRGRLEVAATTRAASSLLESFIGSPQAARATDSRSAAIICELNRMICGRFLSWLAPAEEIFMSEAALIEPPDSESSIVFQQFLLDSGSLTASVKIA